MKKIYIQPTTRLFSLTTEGLIAASGNIGMDSSEGNAIDPENAFSNGKGAWDSESWSTDEEEF